jgi:magnesium-transporting ATPase (P-type)
MKADPHTSAPAATAAPPYHAQDIETVLLALGTDASHGLSEEEARARLERYGPNRLSERRRRGPLARFLLQFHNVLIYILLAAAAVTAALGHWVDSSVIVGVVAINALVGFIQEGKAEQALAAIRRLLSLRATVLRGGHVHHLEAEQLVPGDIVLLQSGDRVPADLRLIRVKNLHVDESSLTGESVPVEKAAEPVPAESPLAERRAMVYSGTFVTQGQGWGVVVATGDATELGRLSALIAEVRRIDTPLLRKLSTFGRWLGVAILALAAATFAFGVLARGYPPIEMFMAAVGLAVAAIPEGLPAIITITLALGVERMARRHAIVRVLPAVEALGSVTVILSDKTGTLTRNEMTVRAVVTAERHYEVSGVGYAPHGAFLLGGKPVEPSAEPDLLELLRAALLCNDARLERRDGDWRIVGDPTEGALVVAAVKAGLDAAIEAERYPRRDVIPFESEQRFMATLHHDHAGHGFIYLKGAPERVLEMCSLERVAGEDRPLIDRQRWQARIEGLAAQGMRVLAVATRAAPGTREGLRYADIETGLTLLGLAGLMDPPREEAIRAVAACQRAGIRVKMITGDHKATAVAVARALGIGAGEAAALSGPELDRLDSEALARLAPEIDIYARVTPEHKLRLVEALQARGEVVAMTGDGVNDAPALKRADVGIAMGQSGTEVAKEAAEIVLADDNFASIANAVEEGRTIYDNLRKTILFIMPTNAAQASVIVAAVAAGWLLPILPVQILWVNLITAVTLALALAFEPSEADVMHRPPRPPGAPLFSRYFLWRTLYVTLLLVAGTLAMFQWELGRGADLETARTAAVNMLVLFEAAYLFNTRHLFEAVYPQRAFAGNRAVRFAVGLVIAAQLLYTYAPFMQALFQTRALAAEAWGRMALLAIFVYAIVELEKALMRRAAARRGVLG